jgi:hypothetical protein
LALLRRSTTGFTEGFDATGLKAAKAVLGTLQ